MLRLTLGQVLSLACALAAVALPMAARADVVVDEQLTMDGFGPMKIGAMEGSTTTSIAGDRMRSDSRIKFKSKLLRAFTKDDQGTAQIIRLDQERIYDVDFGRKSYTETTFEEMRRMISQAAAKVNEAASEPDTAPAPSGVPVDEESCEWSPPKAELVRDVEKAAIAGYEASRNTITVSQTCTDKKTGQACDFVYSIDSWLTRQAAGSEEAEAFWKAYAKKLDLSGEMAAEMRKHAGMVFQRYEGAWSEALAQAQALQGYPMRTTFSMAVGGPQCSQDTSPGSGSDGTSASPAPGSITGAIATSLYAKFKRKKEEPEAATAAPGMVQMFRMSTETTSIRGDSLPASLFEVPAGFTKEVRTAPAP